MTTEMAQEAREDCSASDTARDDVSDDGRRRHDNHVDLENAACNGKEDDGCSSPSKDVDECPEDQVDKDSQDTNGADEDAGKREVEQHGNHGDSGSSSCRAIQDEQSEDSTSCSPREERMFATSPALPVVPPVGLTNFSIAEILKPEFGSRKCSLHFRPALLPASSKLDVPRDFSRDSRERTRHELPRHSSREPRDQARLDLLRELSRGTRGQTRLELSGDFSRESREKATPLDFSRDFSRGRAGVTKRGEEVLGRERKGQSESRVSTPGASSSDGDPPPRSPSASASPRRGDGQPMLWPAWVYCTRYSDRPSAGPRSRKRPRRRERSEEDEKRPRTAFSSFQLQRLRQEFDACRYLTEQRRRDLAHDLQLTEAQIKIWFQNKRAKIKKASGLKNPLALSLMAQGLYNHATVSQGETDSQS